MSSRIEDLKALARVKRAQFGLTSDTISIPAIKRIYKSEGIALDLWPASPRIRAIYMCEDGDPSVMLNRNLPREPRIFSLVHELKHHFCDRLLLESALLPCGDYNANREIEVGAEVFAAEFIYPEEEFLALAEEMLLTKGNVKPEQVVRLKARVSAPVSYKFICKRLEFFRLIRRGEFSKVKFKNLEEELFGTPIYRQPWFRVRRRGTA